MFCFTGDIPVYNHPVHRAVTYNDIDLQDHIFLPYDIHTDPVNRTPYKYAIVHGQFDDDSSDSVDA